MPHPQASGERSRPVVDLFSGAVGAWSLGMHRAGYQTVAACEADPWRRAVYSVNNPGVRLYDDVRTLTADRIVSDCGHLPFAIVGSPPCQDMPSAMSQDHFGLRLLPDTARFCAKICGALLPPSERKQNEH